MIVKAKEETIKKMEALKMTKFEQIEDFMENLLDKLPEDERAKVDPQIYYDADKNSIEFMLNVNGNS